MRPLTECGLRRCRTSTSDCLTPRQKSRPTRRRFFGASWKHLLAQVTPLRKSSGPDRQLLRNLPITAYADLACLFQDLLNKFTLSSAKRPQEWTQAVAALIEKQKGASELRRFRPISLLSHVHKLYCKWLMLSVQGKVDEQGKSRWDLGEVGKPLRWFTVPFVLLN